jgi:hypothetical protein
MGQVLDRIKARRDKLASEREELDHIILGLEALIQYYTEHPEEIEETAS